MPLAVFGYGSLRDEESMRLRTPGAEHFCRATLLGYRLLFNKPGITHRYLNIEKLHYSEVQGVIVYVTDAQFLDLARRETGYHTIDVTSNTMPDKWFLPETRVVAFSHFGLPFVRMSYVNKVLKGIPYEECAFWLADIDFQGATIELDEEPLCGRDKLERCKIKYLTTEEIQEWWDERTCADLEVLRRNSRQG